MLKGREHRKFKRGISQRRYRMRRIQIRFVDLVSSKDFYKRPSRVVCKTSHVGVSFEVEPCVQKEWGVGGGWVIWVLQRTGTISWCPEVS